MKHYVAVGDSCVVFEGEDAQRRAERFAKALDKGKYQGPLNLRGVADRFIVAGHFRNVYEYIRRRRWDL